MSNSVYAKNVHYFRYLSVDAERQTLRTVCEFDGHEGDALPPSPNRQPVTQPGTIHNSDRGPAGNARPNRQEPT